MCALHQTGDCIYIGIAKHIIVTNAITGIVDMVKLPDLPKSIPETDQRHDGIIEAISTSADSTVLIVSNSLKQLVVFDTSDFKVLQNLIVNKAAVKICVDNKRNILIADKSGDVYLCENNERPKLILGHLSMLLDMLLTPDNKFLITCDRDDKIRVSHYPNCYNILCYCLGHKEFVTNIAICNYELISASGDGTVKVWDYNSGKELHNFDANLSISDANILRCFQSEMNKLSVEVSAIPISNMQIYQTSKGTAIIAIQLCTINKIEIYELCNKQTLKHSQTLDDFTSTIVNFNLNQVLVVVTENDFVIYDYCMSELKFIRRKNMINVLQEISSVLNQHTLFQNQRDVTLLYKRKFDNVQEYLERKKQRVKPQ